MDPIKTLWENPRFTLKVEADKFLKQSWNEGEAPPTWFLLFGELHIPKSKRGPIGDQLKEKSQKIWKDCQIALLATQKAVQERRPLTEKEQLYLRTKILPICATPYQYAAVLGFPKGAYAPEPHNWFERLYEILDHKGAFPEYPNDQRKFELCLTRELALTRISDSGHLVDFNWIDLIAKFGQQGIVQQQKADVVLRRLKLRKDYDDFFVVFSLLRELGEPFSPIDSFKRYVVTVTVEELRRFSLKLPSRAYCDLEELLFGASVQDRLHLLFFYRAAEIRLGSRAQPRPLQEIGRELSKTLQCLFETLSAMKDWLFATLLFSLTSIHLKKLGYPPLGEECQKIYFDLCLRTPSGEMDLLFEKLFKIPPCTIIHPQAYRACSFVHLSQKKWLTPPHLIWLLFHFLELEMVVQIPSDKLAPTALIECVEKIHAFLGYFLPSEQIQALFGGSLIDVGAPDIVTLLPIWRKELYEERREFLPHFFKDEFPRRQKEIVKLLSDSSPFQAQRKRVIDILWFSTYLPPLYGEGVKAIPLFPLQTGQTQLPLGLWLHATNHFAEGPHIRCQWFPVPEREEFRFEVIYTPSLIHQRTISRSVVVNVKDFSFENDVIRDGYFSLVENHIPQEFSNPVASSNRSLLIPYKTEEFFRKLKIAFRQLSHLCSVATDKIAALPPEEILKQRMTFPVYGGVSLFPAEHPLSSRPEYVLFRGDKQAFMVGLIGNLKHLHTCSTTILIDKELIEIELRVEEKKVENYAMFLLSARVELEGIKYFDQVAFPQRCAQKIKEEVILGLLAQFRGLIYRERLCSNAKHLQSQKESLEP